MITEMKRIPITTESYPFQAAAGKCEFDRIGYIEDEYFMSGTANIYTESDSAAHSVEVLYADAPYTTRLLVRRPADAAKFSGNVCVEILNASAMMDIDRMWVNSWKYMTRNGDIYIGITSKGHVVDTLKRFDAKRYEAINWANPLPDRKAPERSAFEWLPQYESGLYWDMQSDLARLLRTDDELNPIREYGKCWLYLLGWSQSGSYMSRTIHSFAYREEEKYKEPLFDGYFEAGAGDSLAPINAYELVNGGGVMSNGSVPRGGIMISKQPYIALNTECEDLAALWTEDSDEPGYKFRTYQVAGTSHDEAYNMLDYYEGYLREDAKRSNIELAFSGAKGEPLDTPYEFVFAATLRNLYAWVRQEIPAPHAPAIEKVPAGPEDFDALSMRSGDGKNRKANRKDMFGNTMGGIRLANMDYPVGRYESFSTREDGSIDPMFGTVYPFSAKVLQEIYGSLSHYRELVEKQAERTIALGFLLREDKKAYVDTITEQAARRGLV